MRNLDLLENYNQNEYENEKSFFSLRLLSEVKRPYKDNTDILRENGGKYARLLNEKPQENEY